jgi:retinoblastoma-like protein 1
VACDHDISGEVTHRAKVLVQVIFSIDGANNSRDSRGITALLDSAWVEQRRLEATKLYYRVLTAMCKAESQRLDNKNLTALLTNERFHRCMIACSAELVLYTHKTVTMTFPAVLEPTGITAFDLSKVIESFVRHEETLPRELKRHLNSMEQQILESMAWEKGSSMYNSLVVAKKHLASDINQLGLLADPMPALDNLTQHILKLSGNLQREPEGAAVERSGTPSGSGTPSSPQKEATASASNVNGPQTLINGAGDQAGNLLSPLKDRPSAFSAFSSPVKSRPQPTLQSVFASPQKPSPLGGGETCAETVINVFFLKVLKLAAVRTKDLCERLQQSNQVWEQVYRTMQHLLYKETSLFFNRHIDQLILCSIYGVCKVNKANVTFKKCIEHYSKQPQCKRQVFCNVLLEVRPKGQEIGDIIKFYNQIFVPATKQYLVQLGENVSVPALNNTRPGDEDKTDKNGPGSPRPALPAVPDMSPKKVSASHNVYVSPLRSTKVYFCAMGYERAVHVW